MHSTQVQSSGSRHLLGCSNEIRVKINQSYVYSAITSYLRALIEIKPTTTHLYGRLFPPRASTETTEAGKNVLTESRNTEQMWTPSCLYIYEQTTLFNMR